MSAFFIVTPVLTNIAWPVLSSVIVSALANIGYSAVKGKSRVKTEVKEKEEVELDLKNASAIGETLGEEEELVMTKGDITLAFRKDIDGKCKINVCAEGKSREELKKIGTEASNQIIQAYIRQKVLTELKQKGFSVVQEEKDGTGTIKLRVRKWA